MMLECRDIDEKLLDYLYDELDAATREAFEAHVGGCLRCQGEVRAYQGVRREARKLADLEPPAGVTTALMREAVRAQQRGQVLPFWRRILHHPAYAMAAALVVVGGIAGWQLWRQGHLIEAPAHVSRLAKAPAAESVPSPIPQAQVTAPPAQTAQAVPAMETPRGSGRTGASVEAKQGPRREKAADAPLKLVAKREKKVELSDLQEETDEMPPPKSAATAVSTSGSKLMSRDDDRWRPSEAPAAGEAVTGDHLSTVADVEGRKQDPGGARTGVGSGVGVRGARPARARAAAPVDDGLASGRREAKELIDQGKCGEAERAFMRLERAFAYRVAAQDELALARCQRRQGQVTEARARLHRLLAAGPVTAQLRREIERELAWSEGEAAAKAKRSEPAAGQAGPEESPPSAAPRQ